MIGGFQDSTNSLNLLFFKLDRVPTTTLPILTEVFEAGSGVSVEEQRKDIETLINKTHLDN